MNDAAWILVALSSLVIVGAYLQVVIRRHLDRKDDQR